MGHPASRTSTRPPASPTRSRAPIPIRRIGAASWCPTGPARSRKPSGTGSRRFDRMREDQEFCFGKQWSKNDAGQTLRRQPDAAAGRPEDRVPVREKPQGGGQEAPAPERHLLGRIADHAEPADAVRRHDDAAGAGRRRHGRRADGGRRMPPMPPGMMGQVAGAAQGAIGGMMPMATGQPPDIGHADGGRHAAATRRRCRRRR